MRMPNTVGGLREALAMFPDDTRISCLRIFDGENVYNESIDIDVDEYGTGATVQLITYGSTD